MVSGDIVDTVPHVWRAFLPSAALLKNQQCGAARTSGEGLEGAEEMGTDKDSSGAVFS